MNMKWKHYLGILSILCILLINQQPRPVQAATIITGSTTWNGNVYPDQDVIVQSGGTLTVASGTTVLMDCTDTSFGGYDIERIEIIVESGGTLTVDGATIAGSGYPSDHCWYGIEFESGSSGYIKNSNIRDGIKGINLQSNVEISGNLIEHMYGEDGDDALSSGGDAWGIEIETAGESPLVANNEILHIHGGQGWDGALDKPSSSGGAAYGIHVIDGSPDIDSNEIHVIYAGAGGDGGNGSDGADGEDCYTPGGNGENGNPGNPGQNGSVGGIGAGIYFNNVENPVITGNTIYAVRSGASGNGGSGGNGGDGGDGAMGESSKEFNGGPGGSGGDGGNGGAGGHGGTSRKVYGIYASADSIEISQNILYNIESGVPGLGGSGGNGGLGGNGGDGGKSDLNGGNGGNGGAGGMGGIGGSGGFAGKTDYVIIKNTSLSILTQNRLSGGLSQDGNSGGTGGDGGDGGSAGNGGLGILADGNGGIGGAGGTGGSGGEGGNGGTIWGANLDQLLAVPIAMTNNIINEMASGQGGSGGNGGNGGTGGMGGTGDVDGPSGDGGDAGSGQDGGNSAESILLFIRDHDLNVVNNTFYFPEAPTEGGAGGLAGAPGAGGKGTIPGYPGESGADGSQGNGGLAIGLTGSGAITLNIFNNIFAGSSSGNSIGIMENASMTFNIDYNDFWNWTDDFFFPYTSEPAMANNIDVFPDFVHPAIYDFHLTESSGCIDTGNNSATGAPDEDFEGNPRPLDGDKNGSIIIDMGAFEINTFLYSYLPLIIK